MLAIGPETLSTDMFESLGEEAGDDSVGVNMMQTGNQQPVKFAPTSSMGEQTMAWRQNFFRVDGNC